MIKQAVKFLAMQSTKGKSVLVIYVYHCTFTASTAIGLVL